jgi:uncharacterized protein YdcH (DUF465 family)
VSDEDAFQHFRVLRQRHEELDQMLRDAEEHDSDADSENDEISSYLMDLVLQIFL